MPHERWERSTADAQGAKPDRRVDWFFQGLQTPEQRIHGFPAVCSQERKARDRQTVTTAGDRDPGRPRKKNLNEAPFAGSLLFLRLSSPFRAVCSFFSDCLVPFERLAPLSQIVLSLSSGSLLFFRLSSPFRAVRSSFSACLVPFERFAPFFQIV